MNSFDMREDYLRASAMPVHEAEQKAIKLLQDGDRLHACSLRHVDSTQARAHIPIDQLDAYDEYRKLEMSRQVAEFLMREGLIVFDTDRKVLGTNSITASLTVLVPEKEKTDGEPV